MRTARRARFEQPLTDPAQPSLFPDLPPPKRIQPAVRLTEGNVARTVPPACSGVFFVKTVGPGGRVIERVGRDDVDLRQRLLELARSAAENVLFGWILADGPTDAYRLECYLREVPGAASPAMPIPHPPSPSPSSAARTARNSWRSCRPGVDRFATTLRVDILRQWRRRSRRWRFGSGSATI